MDTQTASLRIAMAVADIATKECRKEAASVDYLADVAYSTFSESTPDEFDENSIRSRIRDLITDSSERLEHTPWSFELAISEGLTLGAIMGFPTQDVFRRALDILRAFRINIKYTDLASFVSSLGKAGLSS